MAKGFIDKIFNQIFDADWVGRHGEKLTERELNLVRLFGRKGRVLRNVYVPKDNGETSEIDVVFITQKGIFVIESKNYSGWIFGDEKAAYWTAMLPNKQKNQFYNPIKQNKTHIKWLGQYLSEEIPLFSIIVFSERCELKKVTVESSDIHVIKRDYLYATIRKIWDNTADCLDEVQLMAVYSKLRVLTSVDAATKQAHVENIKKKYAKVEKMKTEESLEEKQKEIKSVESEKTMNSEEELVCPRCGSKLVLRTAKKGANAGNQFYGCANFPKCRYIKNVED